MGRPVSKAAAGTRLFMGDLGSEPTERIGGIRDYSELPNVAFDEFETTEVDGMNGEEVDMQKYHEPGKFDPGQAVMTFSADDVVISRVYQEKGKRHSWKIVHSDGSYIPFNGWIKIIKPQGSKEDVTFVVTIRADSDPVPVAASAATAPATVPTE